MEKREVVAVRADRVDDAFFFETQATFDVAARLHEILELTRQDPQPWFPAFCLCGPSGVGKTTLVQRIARQAQRAVSCRPMEQHDRRGYQGPGNSSGSETARRFGSCPAICSPVMHLRAWEAPIGLMKASADNRFGVGLARIAHAIEGTPGDRENNVLRRTGIVVIDDADRLMTLSHNKLQTELDLLDDRNGPKAAYLFVGSDKLADRLATHGVIQRIPLPAMELDAEFETVVTKVFGPLSKVEIADLHRGSGGCMGRLMTLASLAGLKPPYHVPEKDVARLPPQPQE